MKSKKDLIKLVKTIIILYIIMIAITYFFIKIIINLNVEYNNLNSLDINKIIFLYPAIFCAFIFIIFITKVLFLRKYVNKKTIKNCSYLNMIVPSKERYKRNVNNLSEVQVRQFFVEKTSNNLHKFKTLMQHKKNFYLSNEKNELLYVFSTLSTSVSDINSKYSIIDPYNNDIGEIKIKEPTLLNLQDGQEIWMIILNNKQSFQIAFDLYNFNARKENVIKIIGLPLQFNNNFFDEQHLINLECNLIDTTNKELMAEMHDLGVFGNLDINIYNSKYALEIIIIYMCILLKKYNDGINMKVIMTKNFKK